MKRVSLATLAVLVATPMAVAQEYSAGSVAAAVLTGFVQRDVAMIAGHSNETNAGFFADLASGAEDVSELWDADRGNAGMQWDGMILPVRYNDRGHAIVPFAIEGATGPASLTTGVDGRYMSVVLTLDSPEDTTWGFEDINYIRPADYATMATSR